MKPRYLGLVPLAAALILAGGAALLATNPDPSSAVDWRQAMSKLREGNERFAASKITQGKPVAERRLETVRSQHPFAVVVTCSDSRVPPELVFDQNLGDLFVIRTAGNLVDDDALASIEYAVMHLNVRLIVVLGHESCGAIKAALASATAPGHINSLVRDIQPAVNAAKGKEGDPIANTVKENVVKMAEIISQNARYTTNREDMKQHERLQEVTRVVQGVYDLNTGRVAW